MVVDGAATPDEVAAFLRLARALPVAPAEKAACADRSYFYDADGAFGRRFAGVAAEAWGVSVTRIRVNRCYRVLSYARAGGCLPAHVDLHRDLRCTNQISRPFSRHWFICAQVIWAMGAGPRRTRSFFTSRTTPREDQRLF